jgi:hypothetical protein
VEIEPDVDAAGPDLDDPGLDPDLDDTGLVHGGLLASDLDGLGLDDAGKPEGEVDTTPDVLDTDRDGVGDLYLYDDDGDGRADYVEVDLDGDGRIDGAAVDQDFDGVFDVLLADVDGDGEVEAYDAETLEPLDGATPPPAPAPPPPGEGLALPDGAEEVYDDLTGGDGPFTE